MKPIKVESKVKYLKGKKGLTVTQLKSKIHQLQDMKLDSAYLTGHYYRNNEIVKMGWPHNDRTGIIQFCWDYCAITNIEQPHFVRSVIEYYKQRLSNIVEQKMNRNCKKLKKGLKHRR